MKIAMVKDRLGFYSVYQDIFKAKNIDVDLYDIWQQSEQERLFSSEFDAFVWRAKHNPPIKRLAGRMLYFFDQQMHIPTLPDWHSYWHYDDKISQYYLMRKLDIPCPQTHIFHRKEEALAFCEQAEYPLIYKSAHGAGSLNVGLLETRSAAVKYVKQVFSKKGMKTFFKSEKQKGYAYLQNFLPGNSGDYRLVVYGDMISGFFRENRTDVAMASGSGKFSLDELPHDLLDFIADVHSKLGSLFIAYDVLTDPAKGWVVTEFSVIHGDLNSEELWKKAPYYHRNNGAWQRIYPKKNRHELLIDLYLQKWK